jgi:hypothetical protein
MTSVRSVPQNDSVPGCSRIDFRADHETLKSEKSDRPRNTNALERGIAECRFFDAHECRPRLGCNPRERTARFKALRAEYCDRSRNRGNSQTSRPIDDDSPIVSASPSTPSDTPAMVPRPRADDDSPFDTVRRLDRSIYF